MPYFFWSGVDYNGQMHYGRQFAHSQTDLIYMLVQRDIGLVDAREYKNFWLDRRISATQKAKFIQHLALLLKSEVRLHQALQIIIKSIDQRYLKSVVTEISESVSQGVSLSEATAQYPNIFDELFVSLVYIGQETGKLPVVLEKLAEHTQETEQFRTRVRSALMGPVLTGSIFLLLLISVFIFVIPRFQTFFAGYTQPLPQATQLIFKISNALTAFNLAYIGIILLITIFVLQRLLKKPSARLVSDQIIWHVPIVKNYIQKFYYTRFFQMLSILLHNGIKLPRALNIAQSTINNKHVAQEISAIQNQILSGSSLKTALANSTIFNAPELEALVSVGEESSNLAHMIGKASEIYQARVYESLGRFTTIIQPLLLVFLGLCIAGLIFAVYMPLLTLSYVVG